MSTLFGKRKSDQDGTPAAIVRRVRELAGALYALINNEPALYLLRRDPPMSNPQFRLIYHTDKSVPVLEKASSQSPKSSTGQSHQKNSEPPQDAKPAEAPPHSFKTTGYSYSSHKQESVRTEDSNSGNNHSGTLYYRAPDRGHLFVKYFAWFWSSDGIAGRSTAIDRQIKEFLATQDEEIALRIAKWWVHSRESLLFLAKKRGQPISGIIQLAYATQPVQDDMQSFSFKIGGLKHAFEARDAAHCKTWYCAISETISSSRFRINLMRPQKPQAQMQEIETFMGRKLNVPLQVIMQEDCKTGHVLEAEKVEPVVEHNKQEESGNEGYDADLAKALELSKMLEDSSQAAGDAEIASTSPTPYPESTQVPDSSGKHPTPPPSGAATEHLAKLTGIASSSPQQSTQFDTVSNNGEKSPGMLSTSPVMPDAFENIEQVNEARENDTRDTRNASLPTQSQQELGIIANTTQPQSELKVLDEKDIDPENDVHSVDQLSFITAEDQEEFHDLFIGQVGSTRGYMSVGIVRDTLSQYSLPEGTVARIILLCDTQLKGQLSFSEFALAMYYGIRARVGKPLPSILPSRLNDEVSRQKATRTSRTVTDPGQIRQPRGPEPHLSRLSSAPQVLSQPHSYESMAQHRDELDRLSSPQVQYTSSMNIRRKPLLTTVEPTSISATSSRPVVDINDSLYSQARQEIASYPAVDLRSDPKDATISSQSGPIIAHLSWDSSRDRLSSTSSTDLPQDGRRSSQLRSDTLVSSRTPEPYRTFTDTPPPPSTFTPQTLSSQDLLANRLNSYFFTGTSPREHYTDTEIQEVSELLRQFNPRWSRVPRTYVVLRTISSLDILDRCVDVGFSDYWFPVTERSLPEFIRPSIRAAFVGAQRLILTKSMDLEKGEQGRHCYFQKGDSLPFEMKGILGSGGYGQVDKVLSLISFKQYARKRVLRSSAFRGRNKEGIRQVISEIEILKGLKHRHVVEFVGSYTDAKYIGLIMTPIAEGDLSSYMARATLAEYSELRSFFGCLATALDFLHVNNVRHKDIKPGNILVSKGKVLFADFGLSFDFTDATGSTTLSMVNGMTPRYCAPEVANQEARNTMSDIWCLGIVFLEMIVTLKGETTQYMDNFFREHGSRQTFVRLNTSALTEFIIHLTSLPQWTDNRVLDWTAPMLQEVQALRPTASALVTQITSPMREGEQTAFCGICCMMPEEEDFSDYLSD